MLEVHAILRMEVDLGDRNEFALDLAGTAREPELGHVAQSGRLAPAGIADFVSLVERSTARLAARGARLVLCLAPLALNHFHAGKRAGKDLCQRLMPQSREPVWFCAWHCSGGNSSP